MRRMRSIMGGLTANAAGYAAAQVTVAGTPLTLVGTPQLPNPVAGQLHNSAAPVTFTGVAATIASNYTVTGLSRYGNVISEVVIGPVGATTTSGHLLFAKVTSIVPSVTNNPGTVSAGWGGTNYGPWLIIAYHSFSSNVTLIGAAPTFDFLVTDFNLMDPTFFHAAVGGGGTPSGDMNFQGSAGGSPNAFGGGPYIDVPTTPWPLVPATLQAACPQLLSTNQTIPEEDGTWVQSVIAPTTFTSATAGTAGSTTSQVRLDPIVSFAARLRVTSAPGGLVELDVTPQRRSF